MSQLSPDSKAAFTKLVDNKPKARGRAAEVAAEIGLAGGTKNGADEFHEVGVVGCGTPGAGGVTESAISPGAGPNLKTYTHAQEQALKAQARRYMAGGGDEAGRQDLISSWFKEHGFAQPIPYVPAGEGYQAWPTGSMPHTGPNRKYLASLFKAAPRTAAPGTDPVAAVSQRLRDRTRVKSYVGHTVKPGDQYEYPCTVAGRQLVTSIDILSVDSAGGSTATWAVDGGAPSIRSTMAAMYGLSQCHLVTPEQPRLAQRAAQQAASASAALAAAQQQQAALAAQDAATLASARASAGAAAQGGGSSSGGSDFFFKYRQDVMQGIRGGPLKSNHLTSPPYRSLADLTAASATEAAAARLSCDATEAEAAAALAQKRATAQAAKAVKAAAAKAAKAAGAAGGKAAKAAEAKAAKAAKAAAAKAAKAAKAAEAKAAKAAKAAAPRAAGGAPAPLGLTCTYTCTEQGHAWTEDSPYLLCKVAPRLNRDGKWELSYAVVQAGRKKKTRQTWVMGPGADLAPVSGHAGRWSWGAQGHYIDIDE
jgi:hypothetical protein